MKLESTIIEGIYILHRPLRKDDRGTFTRLFGSDEIAKAGRPMNAIHVNTSTSLKTGTLRGIHFQYSPFSEAKVVACTSGAIWDVAIDLRLESPTRFKWFATHLTPENGKSVILPEGVGHAFLTLEPNSSVVYVTSNVYNEKYESGLRYDDPDLAIEWPIAPVNISQKDKQWGLLKDRLKEIDEGFA